MVFCYYGLLMSVTYTCATGVPLLTGCRCTMHLVFTLSKCAGRQLLPTSSQQARSHPPWPALQLKWADGTVSLPRVKAEIIL
jgi:hypothetical protein